MKIKELLKNISGCQIKGSEEICITGMTSHSAHIVPGNLFIARQGKTYNGKVYIPEAIQAGACAVMTDAFDPSMESVVQIIHPQISTIESLLAANYYQHPSQQLFMVGVTGTNGKTTTSFMIKYLLDRLYGPCGLIGTIEYIVGQHRYPATRTTPDVLTNHQLLREMCRQGCRSAVMEVSSHGLDQGRVKHIDFDVAIFSNLTQEHLDYHGSMESYGKAKRQLFYQLGKEISKKERMKWAIVNLDSPWTPYMLKECSANVLTYGIESPADLRATDLFLGKQRTCAKITYQNEVVDCDWPFVGRFNVYNCLAAIAVALSQSIPLEIAATALAEVPLVQGRLQQIHNDLGLKIFVDFAHSDDALMNVLSTLRELCSDSGRLIVVFGCGGDRDRTKRPKMARACEDYADYCIVTSDNPRSEDPSQICYEIVSGFTKKDIFQVELDRRAAIQKAIGLASPDDMILIAGKGHETYQIFANETIEFDDSQVVADICSQLKRMEI